MNASDRHAPIATTGTKSLSFVQFSLGTSAPWWYWGVTGFAKLEYVLICGIPLESKPSFEISFSACEARLVTDGGVSSAGMSR